MIIKKVYTEDLAIAQAILAKDEVLTRHYLYGKYYPLFNSIYARYYTDCTCCKEFIDEIYILILTPNKETGKCQLDYFKGESSLITWLKTICLFYCYKKFRKKNKMFQGDSNQAVKQQQYDRNNSIYASININADNLNREDVHKILNLMPNSSYRKLIRLRYLEQRNNEETAHILGVSMSNYYNMHKRAKEQFIFYCRKEETHG